MRNTLNILKPGFHICQALRLVHSNSNLLPISLILIQRESHWTLQIEMHPSIANILFNHGYCFIVRTCFAKNNWLLWQCNFKENDTCSLPFQRLLSPIIHLFEHGSNSESDLLSGRGVSIHVMVVSFFFTDMLGKVIINHENGEM